MAAGGRRRHLAAPEQLCGFGGYSDRIIRWFDTKYSRNTRCIDNKVNKSQLVVELLVPLWTVTEEVVVVDKQLCTRLHLHTGLEKEDTALNDGAHWLGGDGAWQVAVHRVADVRECADVLEAVVELVAECRPVGGGGAEL